MDFVTNPPKSESKCKSSSCNVARYIANPSPDQDQQQDLRSTVEDNKVANKIMDISLNTVGGAVSLHTTATGVFKIRNRAGTATSQTTPSTSGPVPLQGKPCVACASTVINYFAEGVPCYQPAVVPHSAPHC